MTAELIAHRREDLVGEIRLAARAEALEECRGEQRGRRAGLDRRKAGPAALARVRDPTAESFELRIRAQRRSGQIQEPGGDHAAATPDLGDLADVDAVLIMLRIGQRRGLGIHGLLIQPDPCVFEDVEALRVGSHQRIFDAVVDHLHEMARTVGSAVQIALLGATEVAAPTGRALDLARTGRERGEDWIESLHRPVLSADHQAVAPLQTPDAPAGPAVDEMDPLRCQALRVGDVVAVVRVAPVDDGVVGCEMGYQVVDDLVHDRRRDHDPDVARDFELGAEIGHVLRTDGAFGDQRRDGGGVSIIDDTPVSGAHEAEHHVGAHSAEADHCELHEAIPLLAAGGSEIKPRSARYAMVLDRIGPGRADGRWNRCTLGAV